MTDADEKNAYDKEKTQIRRVKREKIHKAGPLIYRTCCESFTQVTPGFFSFH